MDAINLLGKKIGEQILKLWLEMFVIVLLDNVSATLGDQEKIKPR